MTAKNKPICVVLTGAGISAESGIPTFRAEDGLWAGHKVEEVCTPEALKKNRAKVFTHPDYAGEIGLIMPYEKNFCASCNRLRVSAKGKLHLCLFGEEGIELRDLLQSHEQQDILQARIFSALQGKREHHYLHIGDSGVRNHLASIGG